MVHFPRAARKFFFFCSTFSVSVFFYFDLEPCVHSYNFFFFFVSKTMEREGGKGFAVYAHSRLQ